jgi:hypothetical protein
MPAPGNTMTPIGVTSSNASLRTTTPARIEAGLQIARPQRRRPALLACKLTCCPATSRLPALVEYVVARPVVSAGMIGQELRITLRATQNLGLREATGWARYRAWGHLRGGREKSPFGNLDVQGIRHDFSIQSRLQALPSPRERRR